MKRLFTLFLSLFVIFLCSCERGNKLTVNTPLNFKEYTYCGITDYANADKLVNDADVILTGTVKNISFKLFDEAMKKEIKNTASKKESLLCTVYTVEVKTVLKGKADGAVDIVVKGGIPDKYEKEQLEAFGEKPDKTVYYSTGTPTLDTDKRYMFVLSKKNGRLTLIDPFYSVYPLMYPLGNMPDMPPLSPSDIAAACGEESEKAFWAQWQNDNPNWRQRDDAKELSKIIEQKVTE